MSDTRAPRFVFSLAGSWWRLPVADEAEAERAIDRLVLDTAGRADEAATFRRLLRDRFRTTVAEVRRGEADYLYIAREIAPGLPLSAALTVSRPAIGALPAGGSDPAVAVPALAVALAGLDAPGSGVTSDERELSCGPVLRRVRTSEVVLDGEPVDGDADLLRADYWVPMRGGFVLFTFSTVYTLIGDRMLELFDAIVGTVRADEAAIEPVAGVATA